MTTNDEFLNELNGLNNSIDCIMSKKKTIIENLYKAQEIFKEATNKLEKLFAEDKKLSTSKEIDFKFRPEYYKLFFRSLLKNENDSTARGNKQIASDSLMMSNKEKILSYDFESYTMNSTFSYKNEIETIVNGKKTTATGCKQNKFNPLNN